MRKRFLLGAAVCALAATPAAARLQLSISANGSTFSCFDGEASCDLNGGANNLLTVDQTVGGVFVELTLAQSAFGPPDSLQLSSSNIVNNNSASVTVGLVAGDNGFFAPVSKIQESASLTFNKAVGSGSSFLQFWADPANVQGANPTNTPGQLLDTVTGTPTTDPDSFSGSKISTFVASSPFSMTESASLNLISGGSVTGFNEAMLAASAIPEPKTWVMLGLGFGLLGLVGARQRRSLSIA